MPETAFPATPWRYEDLTGCIYQNDGVLNVCEFRWADLTQEEIDRCGNLIAAAPDLYEACESAAESLRSLLDNSIDCGCEGGGISEPEHLCGYHKSLFALEDATKKARGEA